MVKLNFDVFEMRFVVRAGVKSNDLHALGCRRIAEKKQGEWNFTVSVPILPAVPIVLKVRVGARQELTTKGRRQLHRADTLRGEMPSIEVFAVERKMAYKRVW